jgi:hypothetical protein
MVGDMDNSISLPYLVCVETRQGHRGFTKNAATLVAPALFRRFAGPFPNRTPFLGELEPNPFVAVG